MQATIFSFMQAGGFSDDKKEVWLFQVWLMK